MRKRDKPHIWIENAVPRKELPDIDRIVREYEIIFKKVCLDLKKTWWKQIKVWDIEEEIRSTVMVIFFTRWDHYRKGEIDEFPPTAGFLYISAKWMMQKQWAPSGDVLRHYPFDNYNQVESGITLYGVFTGNVIIVNKAYFRIATEVQKLNYVEPDEISHDCPDLVDIWCMGFTTVQLGILYGVNSQTIRARLHRMYDAMKSNGIKVPRSRPGRRIAKKTRASRPKSNKSKQ